MHGQSFRWDADSLIAARGFTGYLLIRHTPVVAISNNRRDGQCVLPIAEVR